MLVFAHSASPSGNFSDRWRPSVDLSEDAATKQLLGPMSGFYLNFLILDLLEPGQGGGQWIKSGMVFSAHLA